MKAVSSLLLRLPDCSPLFAAVVLVIGFVFALQTSASAVSFTFTTVDAPEVIPMIGGNFGTDARGINAAGQMVGVFVDAAGGHGFVDTGGVFTTIDVPGASSTAAFGINDMGQIVGFFADATGGHGFLDTGGVFTTIDVPGASFTQANGINAAGQIVGLFGDATGAQGFFDAGGIFTPIVFTPIDGPRTLPTDVIGISAMGQIVGAFTFNGTEGFLDSGGVFTTIDVPGANFFTVANGINVTGQIVGTFRDATGPHGFLATPIAVPAPSTLLLLGTALALGAAGKGIRRRSGHVLVALVRL